MTSTTPRSIGFIGIGNMGWPMAERLVGAGFEVAVADARPGRSGEFARSVGGHAGTSAEVAAAAEVLITMLPTSDHVGQVIGEVADVLADGAVLIEMSSGIPSATRRFAERLAAGGVAVVDCPVSGGVARARTGELAIMAGGSDDDLDHVAAVLSAIGSSLHRCGPLGAGQAMKALNNLVSAAGLLVTCEALLAGRRFGLDPAIMVDILNASSGANNSTKNKIRQFVLSRTFDSGFGLDLMAKDLRIALAVARDSGTVTPLSSACEQLWSAAAELLGPGLDHTAVARFTEAVGGGMLTGAPA